MWELLVVTESVDSVFLWRTVFCYSTYRPAENSEKEGSLPCLHHGRCVGDLRPFLSDLLVRGDTVHLLLHPWNMSRSYKSSKIYSKTKYKFFPGCVLWDKYFAFQSARYHHLARHGCNSGAAVLWPSDCHKQTVLLASSVPPCPVPVCCPSPQPHPPFWCSLSP